MIWQLIAAFCSGTFAGAALYISAVEHPARLECGTPLALREFVPSYRRATVMQASLAAVGCLAAAAAWSTGRGSLCLLGAILLGHQPECDRAFGEVPRLRPRPTSPEGTDTDTGGPRRCTARASPASQGTR